MEEKDKINPIVTPNLSQTLYFVKICFSKTQYQLKKCIFFITVENYFIQVFLYIA